MEATFSVVEAAGCHPDPLAVVLGAVGARHGVPVRTSRRRPAAALPVAFGAAHRFLLFVVSTVLLSAASGLSCPRDQAPASQLPRRVDPQAQQILDRVIRAIGGEAFLHVKTLTTRGRVFAIRDETTSGLENFQSWVEYPDKRRFSYGKEKPVILINNGEKGWEIDRYGLIDQPAEQVRRWVASNRYSVENLLRLRINEPGVLIQARGGDFVDNVPTQVIEITGAGEPTVRVDFNRHTALPIRITYEVRNPKTGDSDDYADSYADYKEYDGIQTPMHITRYMNGERVGETFRNFANYNESYPAKYFVAE